MMLVCIWFKIDPTVIVSYVGLMTKWHIRVLRVLPRKALATHREGENKALEAIQYNIMEQR
jgi:hypothetical protein